MPRRLGQHFLVRQSVLERIAAAVGPAERIIEIGPGKGALTAHLLAHGARVFAIEIDPVLVQYLRAKFRDEPRLEIIEGDVLKADLARWMPAAVVGNLPYYITSPILEKTLARRADLASALFLVQKEVAERITAAPGSRDYGYLSVSAQLLSTVELLFTVPADAFRPPPKVESAIIRLVPRATLAVDDPEAFLRFVARCFRQKRKTLRNNLAGFYGREALDGLPEGGLRAEQLSIERLAGLYRRLNQT